MSLWKKGRGDKCPNCGRLTVHNQNGKLICKSCGATFKGGKHE